MSTLFRIIVVLLCPILIGCTTTTKSIPVVDGSTRALTVGDPKHVAMQENADQHARRQLQKKLTMTIEGTKLVNLLDALEEEIDIPIHVNWAALESAGVEKDVPVTTRAIKGITVEQAIHVFFDIASSEHGLEPMGFTVREGMLVISTQRDLNKQTITRIYDVRDLIEPVPTVPRKLGFEEADMTIRLSFPGNDTRTTTLFDDYDTDPRDERSEIVGKLIELIQEHVGKQQYWYAYGGEVSSIREFDGDLIVKAPPDIHAELSQLLTGLRVSRAKARQEFEEQWKRVENGRVPELVEQLRRMEAKFDKFNDEYYAELAAKRKKAAQE